MARGMLCSSEVLVSRPGKGGQTRGNYFIVSVYTQVFFIASVYTQVLAVWLKKKRNYGVQ